MAPSTFQRVMDTALAGLKWHTCLFYLDDVVEFARTFDEYLASLESVPEAIRTSGLTLKQEKCQLVYEELTFLGQLVKAAGVFLTSYARTTGAS